MAELLRQRLLITSNIQMKGNNLPHVRLSVTAQSPPGGGTISAGSAVGLPASPHGVQIFPFHVRYRTVFRFVITIVMSLGFPKEPHAEDFTSCLGCRNDLGASAPVRAQTHSPADPVESDTNIPRQRSEPYRSRRQLWPPRRPHKDQFPGY